MIFWKGIDYMKGFKNAYFKGEIRGEILDVLMYLLDKEFDSLVRDAHAGLITVDKRYQNRKDNIFAAMGTLRFFTYETKKKSVSYAEIDNKKERKS
jgi:hypothetical protein